MKEIKFKVWDKQENKWGNSSSVQYCGRNMIGWVCDTTGRFIIVQYTGLKDKNGVEIYEGDIVKYPFPDYETGKKKIQVMEVRWVEGDACFSLVSGEWDILMDLPTRKFMEIIGNIYENPELLEGK